MQKRNDSYFWLTVVLNLAIVGASCDKPTSTTPPVSSPHPVACAGQQCLQFTKTPAAFCPTLDTGKNNQAFFARPATDLYITPITMFYQTIPTDPNGLDGPAVPSVPQAFKVSSAGAQLPVCEAAVVSGEIYSQRIVVSCETSRNILAGEACNTNETINPPSAIYPFQGRYDKAVIFAKKAGAKAIARYDQRWAPSGLTPSDTGVSCTAVCNSGAIGDVGCLPIASPALNTALFNFVTSWKPGNTVSVAQAASALGIAPKCNRSPDIISASGASKSLISNTGDECAVPASFQGDAVQFIIPKDVAGKAQDDSSARAILFDQQHEPYLQLPKYLDQFSGQVSVIAIPYGTTFVDIRVPTSCVRVDSH